MEMTMGIAFTKSEVTAMQAATLFTNADAMHKYAPSLFATHAHPRMSEKYSFTNTYDIILRMHNRYGMRVVSVQGGSRTYKKVLVRMRSTHYDTRREESAPELIIIDSHDGSSKLTMALGFIRFVCMNGMIAGDMFYNKAFLHRTPDLVHVVMLEMEDINQHVDRLIQRITAMRSYQTTFGDRMVLADAVVRQRWGEEKDAGFIAEMRSRMLEPRRSEDLGNDLYTIMNVLQENCLRGGMTYMSNNNRTASVKPISDVGRNVNINRSLWNAGEQLMQKKAA
jgi:hypothetical protein